MGAFGAGRYEGLTTSDLCALLDSAGALAAELELIGLLDRILEQAGSLTDSPDGAVLLFDPARNRLSFVAAQGGNASKVLERWGEDSEQGVPIARSKAGEVFTTGRPLVADSVAEDAGHFKGVDADTDHTTTSMVCVPLSASGQRIGVMQLLNKRSGRYEERDLVLLEHFSAQAAVAIRNIQLFDQLLSHMGLYGSRRAGVGPAELLEELNAKPHYEEVTVLFADLRGSTRLSQIVDRPEQAFSYLDQFLGLLASTVLDHGGLVNKFLGDGIMAIFRGDGRCERAVSCSLEIVDRFDSLKAEWDDSSNTPLGFLDVGIGVTTDLVLLGTLGAERVREFTVIGISVALANCLTEHARNGRRILVDKRTFRQAQHLVPRFDDPERLDLRSPGQSVGRPFESYAIYPHVASGVASSEAAPARAGGRPEASPDVFISYNHRDSAWLSRLRTHLKPYLRSRTMGVWDDTGIRAGAEWRTEIERALAEAKAAVLLVTPDFLDSDFIAESELPPLLDAARQRGKQILWIPVSASAYDQTDIERYQALSDPSRPLDALDESERNHVLVSIARKIAEAVER